MGALQQAFVLKIRDVFMDCGEGVEAQTCCDFLVRRGVSVLLCEAGKEVDYFFLPPRDGHTEIVANKKRIASGKEDSLEQKSID